MPVQVKKSLVLSIYFVLAVSTLLVFWQVRNFDFINYDDNFYVYRNPHVLNGLTADAVSWAFKATEATNWHPLTWLSLMLDCQLFGPNPGGIHLINVLLHLANTLLLFMVLKKMTGSLWSSAFVAAAFALHPMHVESVAWIAERKDVLSTFFWMLTLLAYIVYVSRPSVFRYIAALAFFALGLMAKPMLVTLPFVLLLLDYWPLERIGRKTAYRLIIEKIPFFILSAVSSVITFLVQRSGGSMVDTGTFLLYDRFANAFLSYARYIAKMFCPQKLAIFYPFDAARVPFWQVAMCALLLLGISIFVVRFGRNQRYLPFGWFWFIGTLIPVIGVVQVGAQAYADRYTYIPYIGLFVIIAWYLPQLLSKLLSALPQRKIVLGSLMVLVLTSLGICAHRQVSYWNNSVTVFSHAIEVTQNNWLAYNDLGNAYNGLGRYTEAVGNFRQAIKINPRYDEAYLNLGNAYVSLARSAEAIDAYKQAVKVNPDYADAYFNLGNAYGSLARSAEAIDAYKQAVKVNSDLYQAYNNLGIVYGGLGRYSEAADNFKQVIKINPDYAQAYNNLGAAYVNLSRYSEAIEVYKQAVRISPNYAEAHYNLGNAYLAIGDKVSALTEYNILKSLNSEFANSLLKEINK